MKPQHWPWTFLVFSALGILLVLGGVAALAGMLKGVHPLFNDELAGWALLVSAIACFLTGAFPLVLRRLAEREGA
jgi:ethanolamine transporter EutH